MDVLLTIAFIYLLPTTIGLVRRHRNRRALAALNVFGGWTVFGWLVALVWSIHADPSSYPRCERNNLYRADARRIA